MNFVLLALLSLAQDDAAQFPTISGIEFSRFPKIPAADPHRKMLHVSPKGDDAADGSEATPLKSFAAALEHAKPGMTVIFHGGKYPLEDQITVSTSDLRVVAAPGETVTVVPANAEVHYALTLQGDDIFLDGINVEGFEGIALSFGREDRMQRNLVFANLTVKGGSDGFRSIALEKPAKRPLLSGLALYNVRIEGQTTVGFNIGEGPVNDIRLEKVTVAMKKVGEGDSGADAIAVESGDNLFIDACDVTGAEGDGIDLKATRVTVYNTIVHDVARNGVKFWRGGDLVNSLVYNTGADASIILDGAGDYRILHSTVAFHARGGQAYALTCGYDQPKEKIRLTLANSIFYKNSGPIWVSQGTEIRVTNCLLCGATEGRELIVSQGEDKEIVVSSDDDWKAVETAKGNLSPSKLPTFVDESKGDFRLKPGSVGMNAGASDLDHAPAADLRGTKRKKTPDLGPFETP